VSKRSFKVEAFGRQIATLDPRGLIQAKRAAGREKDRSALVELESLLRRMNLLTALNAFGQAD
jgi:hypothetical protein